MKFFLWLATLIEDREGHISSKRLGFFWCLWMLNRAVQIPSINEILIWAIVGLAFGLAGLTMPEWFSNIKATKTDSSITTKTTSTTENNPVN
jgi:hypothetical protein